MYFSAKVTNSLLSFLREKGLSEFEVCSLAGQILGDSDECLKDPNEWFPAESTELFLAKVSEQFAAEVPNLMEKVGQSAFRLNSWGALDSVMRMIPRQSDYYSNPESFLSYFVSPQLTVNPLEKGENFFSFNTNLSSEKFPFFTAYMKNALETLPRFSGNEGVVVSWVACKVSIDWREGQKSFPLSQMDYHLKPELMESVMGELHKYQSQLQKTKEELHNLKSAIMKGEEKNFLSEDLKEKIQTVRNNTFRLYDNFVKSQQIVSVLTHQQSKKILKKANWEQLISHNQKAYEKALQSLDEVIPPTKD